MKNMHTSVPGAILLSAAVSMLLAAGVNAQSVPNIGDALREVQPPALPAKPAPALPAIGGASSIEPPLGALPNGETIEVKTIRVIGNRVIATATLSALVADGAGKPATLADLEALAERITRYYRTHGFFVARAYVPAQDVTSGDVKIRVVEGNYGRFHLHNESLVRDTVVQGMLDDVKHYDIVSLDTLERAMLIINDTPGVEVTRADVMPGERVGSSDFAVDTRATTRYDGYLLLDNYGSVYTGKDRASFALDVNSPTGGGDRLSVSGLATQDTGLLNGRLAYALPLAPNGLRGELAASETHYQLGDAYAALDAVGTATGVDATVSYPLRRIRIQTIETSFTLSFKDLVDEIRSTGTRTPKTLTSGTFELSLRDEHTVFAADGLTQASATLTLGNLAIHDAAALALDATGAQSEGRFGLLDANLSRVSALPREFALTTAVRGQYALDNKSLDGSERMAVSGPGGVIAYGPGELIGDSAVFVHADIARPWRIGAPVQCAWALFGEVGEASAWQAPTATTPQRRHIADAGLELNLSYRGALLRADVAHRMDSATPLSEPEPRDRVLVQGGFRF